MNIYPYQPWHIQWRIGYRRADLHQPYHAGVRDDGLPQISMFITELKLLEFRRVFCRYIWSIVAADLLGVPHEWRRCLYYFHFYPWEFPAVCNDSMGTFGMFNADPLIMRLSNRFHNIASQLINLEWVQQEMASTHSSSEQRYYRPAGSCARDRLCVAAADGHGVMLINKTRKMLIRYGSFLPGIAQTPSFISGPVT